MAAIWSATPVSGVHSRDVFAAAAKESAPLEGKGESEEERDDPPGQDMGSVWPSGSRPKAPSAGDFFRISGPPPDSAPDDELDVFTAYRSIRSDGAIPQHDPFSRGAAPVHAASDLPFSARSAGEPATEGHPFASSLTSEAPAPPPVHSFATRGELSEERPAAGHPFATREAEDADVRTGSRRIGTAEVEQPASDAKEEAAEAFERALAAVRAKDYVEARTQLEAAIALDPGNRVYETNLKRVLHRLEPGSDKKAHSPW